MLSEIRSSLPEIIEELWLLFPVEIIEARDRANEFFNGHLRPALLVAIRQHGSDSK
jgi:hypothetical protein